MWLATLAFCVALVLLGVSVADAVRTEGSPTPESAAPEPSTRTPQAVPPQADTPARPRADEPDGRPASVATPDRSAEALAAGNVTPSFPRTELRRAVSQDPFQPDRRAPARRYQLPGQRVVVTRPDFEPVDDPDFRVVGAARMGSGGLVLVQVDEDEPIVAISVGESIDGYMLASVDEYGATLVRDGQSFDLSVREPERDEPRGNRGRQSESDRERETLERLEQIQQQLGRGALQGRGTIVLPGGQIAFPPLGGRGRGGGGDQ
jgi:hypothetical protein